jgi:excisionase family DNA binding protein
MAKLFTIAELAKLARVSRSTLLRERKAGRLRAITIGRAVRISSDDVEAWLQSVTRH